MSIGVAERQDVVMALDNNEFRARDPGKGLEGRARSASATRAMTIGGIDEFVRHRVSDATAIA
jgi:hypothetical protein